MKRVCSAVVAIAAVCMLIVQLASAQGQAAKSKSGNAEEQVKALQAKAIEALMKSDTGFFEKHFANDIVIIHGNGVAVAKAQDIQDLKSGALKYESYDVSDRKIRMYGNTAVVNDVAAAKGLIASKPFSGDYRATWVWVQVNGNWKIVSRQITKIPPKS